MLTLFKPFILTFIPIFVAVDAIGNIPLFLSLSEGLNRKQRKRIVLESTITATFIAISFMLIGKLILRLIGVSISDFQIAGGILLFVIASRLLLPGAKKVVTAGSSKDIGVFPLGTPLITGPAVLTTTLIMLDTFSLWPTFISLLLNMLIVWITLFRADLILKVIGEAGTRAFSKIMYILLAAIAVMLTRRGIMGLLQ